MIIVTGQPRSGTSLIMQTIFLLGFPVFGIPHPPNRDKALQPNEGDFWEHPDTVSGDLSLLITSEIAVKVMLRNAIENVILRPENDKVIFCLRDFTSLAKAQTDSHVASSIESRNLKQNIEWYGKMDEWVGTTSNIKIDLDWFRNNKAAGVQIIKDFVKAPLGTKRAEENII